MKISRGENGIPVPTMSDVLSLRKKPSALDRVSTKYCSIAALQLPKSPAGPNEIPRLENETHVYKLLAERDTRDGISPIAPGFLAHLTESGRVMGFLMEKVGGQFASIDDLAACERALGRFHSDVNRYNFLVDRASGEVRLLDFKHTEIFDPEKAAQEMASLALELSEDTKRGAPGIMEYK